MKAPICSVTPLKNFGGEVALRAVMLDAATMISRQIGYVGPASIR